MAKVKSPEQWKAIRLAIEKGIDIQNSHPEIALDYRKLPSVEEIVAKYRLDEYYSIDTRTACDAVNYALGGHNAESGDFGIDPYDGLMLREEYKSLAKEHQLNALSKRPYITLTQSELRSIKRCGGDSCFIQGKGIHAQGYDERRLNSKKGVEERGYRPWKEEVDSDKLSIYSEKDYVHMLAQSKAFQKFTQIRNQFYPDHETISKEINRLYHNNDNVRTPGAIRRVLSLYIPQRIAYHYSKDLEDIC